MSEIYVVYWSGDEDCGGRNDGPVAAFATYDEAWAEVQRQATEEADRRGEETTTDRWTGEPIDYGDAPGIDLPESRCAVRVRTLAL